MNRKLQILFSIPRSIWFNFRYLPIRQALRLPVWIAPNTHIRNMWRGGMAIINPKFNSIHIGYHVADAIDCVGSHTIINIQKTGVFRIEHDAHIGRGAVICVNPNGKLIVGNKFAVSGSTSFVCSKEIIVGHDVQFSWNSLVMDSDAHKIYDERGQLISNSGAITIGDKVWIAANVTILKNSVIGNNCIVGCDSLVNKPVLSDNCIIAGIPAKVVRKIYKWEI